MSVKISVSIGELIDKITILRIKKKNIQDAEKLLHVDHELIELKATLDSLNLEGVTSFLEDLEEINSELWKIEDDIRDKERAKEFDEEFIELARSVYITNDRRFRAKAQANAKYGADIQEVKSYKDY